MKAGEEDAVLLVEDDDATADLERRVLGRGGIQVRRVARVKDALTLLRTQSFAAVVLDYQLPDGSPWEILEVANSRTPRIPVVLVTAMGNELVAAEAIHRGVAEYVKKSESFWDRLPGIVGRVARLAQAEERLRQADTLFQLVAENASDMIWSADRDGTIRYVSPACRRILGYEPEEIVGRAAQGFFHTEDRPRTTGDHARDGDVGRDTNGLHRFARKDGVGVWLETSSHVTIDPSGQPGESVAISRDVTARKEAQDMLVREQVRLEEAQQIARVGSWDWEIASDLVAWSAELYRIYGLESDAFKASYQGFLERVHPEDLERVDSAVRTALRDRTSFSFVHRVVRPNGAVRVLQTHGKTVVNDDGGPVRMSGTAQDITEQRQLQDALARQAADLKRSNFELERFAYAASHDLRAPLRGITQLAEWIAEDPRNTLSEESQAHLGLMQGRVKRMEALLVDLLEYSRVERKADVLHRVDSAALVGEVAESIQHRPGFAVEVVSPLPILDTHVLPLKRVFMNLIDNAVKHHDRAEGVIRVAAAQAGRFVRFTVADDGPGIAPEHHRRVFDLFQTLKPRDQLEGSGMGLTLVQKIVETAGGEIGIESQGRGAVFWFTWPVQSPAAPTRSEQAT